MHIDENLLEQYLLNPQSLSPQQRTHVEDHLEECPAARSIYRYLQDYYTELEETTNCLPAVYDYFAVPGASN